MYKRQETGRPIHGQVEAKVKFRGGPNPRALKDVYKRQEKGCGMLYTAMINAKALCYDDENTKKMLRMDKDEHPVAVQIFRCV